MCPGGGTPHFALLPRSHDPRLCCLYRPDYRKLGFLSQQFPNTPILALTATATAKVHFSTCDVNLCVAALLACRQVCAPCLRHVNGANAKVQATAGCVCKQVCDDIRSILRIEGCDLFKSSIDRPNLFYEVIPNAMGMILFLAAWVSTLLHSLCASSRPGSAGSAQQASVPAVSNRLFSIAGDGKAGGGGRGHGNRRVVDPGHTAGGRLRHRLLPHLQGQPFSASCTFALLAVTHVPAGYLTLADCRCG